MNENLLTWDFQGYEVRTLNIDGAPWFVAVDVARVLEYQNPYDAILKHTRERQRKTLDFTGFSRFVRSYHGYNEGENNG